jgi:hypothetical protein
MRPTLILFLISILTSSCDFTSPGTFKEISRVYSPDSSNYLMTYEYEQGAWDGDRISLTTILNKKESFVQGKYPSYSSLYFDKIYWKGNDTIIGEEKFTEFINQKSSVKDTTWNGLVFKIIHKAPIDSSFTRKIIYKETSPDKKFDLIVYRYIKNENGYYFLNISIVNKNDSIPKYGNFYVSRYAFDCFTDIKWDKANTLDIKVSSSCYYSFNDYLLENRPAIKYKVQIDDSIKGNIQDYVSGN